MISRLSTSKLAKRSSIFVSILAVVVLAFPTAFAQVSVANLPNADRMGNSEASQETFPDSVTMPPHRFGPALHAPGGRVTAGTANSYNWDGYVVTGTDFTSAKGSWIVPASTCSKSPNAYASIWLGIDGWSDGTVEQTGTTNFCNKTTASYYTWYEFYPAATVVISTIPVKPGDKMSAEITYKNSEFTLEITDETTGKTFSVTKAVSGADRSSAEWITEAPSVVTGITNLADFTKVEFGDDYTGIAGTNEATDSAHSGTIKAFGTSIVKVTQIDFLNYTESAPSGVSSDGTSFTSTWIEYN